MYLPAIDVHVVFGPAMVEGNPSETLHLLNKQQVLQAYLEENKARLGPVGKGVFTTMLGATLRVYHVAGGRLRVLEREHLRLAERRVHAVLPELMPVDARFADRVRALAWRAQPYLLDETLRILVEDVERLPWRQTLSREEATNTWVLLWVAIEALDRTWKRPGGYRGETVYQRSSIGASSIDEQDVRSWVADLGRDPRPAARATLIAMVEFALVHPSYASWGQLAIRELGRLPAERLSPLLVHLTGDGSLVGWEARVRQIIEQAVSVA